MLKLLTKIKKYNIEEELKKYSKNPNNLYNEWFYVGNDYYDLNYFHDVCFDVKIPDLIHECICGIPIECINFYIKNIYTEKILTLGKCCIINFKLLKTTYKKCNNCKKLFRKRDKSNCNNCQK